jgi:hypothetical protein
MNTHSTLLVIAVCGLGACSLAEADEKRPYPSASASASALSPKDLAPPAASGRGAWEPDWSAEPLPKEPSKAPTKAEWEGAPLAKEARVTDPSCTVKRLREWYRVACTDERSHKAIGRISGSMEDVSFTCFGTKARSAPEETPTCNEAAVVFPARRGDRRSFEVFVMGRWSLEADALISMQYLEGDALPLISVQGIRWGF